MTIIAAIDLSTPSVNAARSAVELARRLEDDVLLLNVVQPMSALYPEAALAAAPDMDEPLRQASEQALEKLRQQLASDTPGVNIDKRVVHGRPHEAICQAAVEENARLIVMGSHGRGPGGRLFVGSVAQRTVRQAPCPVLVLREGTAPFEAWLSGVRALRITVGVQRSPATESALRFVNRLRESGPCDVTLVHEYWPPGEYARLGLRGPRELDRDDPEVVAAIERDLREQLPALGGHGQVRWRVRAGWGPVGAQLAMEAESDGADLLVVGTEQPHGLERLRSGSAALSALHAAEMPLLVVPAGHLAHRAPSEATIPLLRSVLVATDLSELGNTAVPHAYGLIRRAGSRVELCHVHERRLPAPAYMLPDEGSRLTGQQRRELELRLGDLVPRQALDLGIVTRTTVIDGGSAAEQILGAARRLGVDAIVVASHGRGGITRALFGSVAEQVVRHSDRPVYVVRHGATRA